jgi:hypothetical protein
MTDEDASAAAIQEDPVRGMTVCPIAVILGTSLGPGKDFLRVSRSAVV